jgi:uncharacterized glyoxalase superfamily protein PhnB/uncharacterized protein YndB with AHSA1/START domain
VTSPRSVTSAVTVSASPQTAFTAFTDEMDLWWVRGPINFFDSARAVKMVCEQGVGGRILEMYGTDPEDALELARITAWEPGRLLVWHSSVDDVQVEVTFTPTAGGTTVQVLATIPVGGQDRGGTAWQRVVPDFFGAWCARRDVAAREPEELDRLAIAVYYRKPVTAARWLSDAFGFASPRRLPVPMPGQDPADLEAERVWLEFRIGHCSLMLFRAEADRPEPATVTHVPWIFVDDLDAHFAHANATGAKIIEAIHQHGYRAYEAEDPEGHRWIFAQARPTMR